MKTNKVGAISRHAQRRQSLLHLEVVEKGIQQTQIGINTLHEMSMNAHGPTGNNKRGAGRGAVIAGKWPGSNLLFSSRLSLRAKRGICFSFTFWQSVAKADSSRPEGRS